MKERIISICIMLLAAVTVFLIIMDLPHKIYARPASDFTETVRNGTPDGIPLSGGNAGSPAVAEEVIRLHILADSDSDRDQAVKLALRDLLLPFIHAAILDAENKTDAMERLNAQCISLTELANVFLAEQNTGYTATVSVERVYFPIRIYGSQAYLSADAVIFPPGYYDSVRVILGSGNGHNWWCLAYPTLCFIDASYDYIPRDSDIYKLKIGTVSESSLKKLFYGGTLSPGNAAVNSDGIREITSGKTDVYFSCKLWEIIRKLLTPAG